MTEDIFQGYKGEALEILKKFNVRVWGKTEISTSRGYLKVLSFQELKMTMTVT